jgi:hypothetical protein
LIFFCFVAWVVLGGHCGSSLVWDDTLVGAFVGKTLHSCWLRLDGANINTLFLCRHRVRECTLNVTYSEAHIGTLMERHAQ